MGQLKPEKLAKGGKLGLDTVVFVYFLEQHPEHYPKAKQQFRSAIAVPQIEQINDSAGRSQLLLNLLVARDLVCAREKLEDGDQPFWRLAGNLEEICRDRDTIRVRIPLEQARKLSDLLFGIILPQTGDKACLDAPRTLLLSALEAACRLANGMKVKRAELTTSKFLERLDREIERLTRK